MFRILVLIILITTANAQTGRYFAYLGGSGDPPGETTIFDSKIPLLGAYARSSDLTTDVAFDGGHSQTETTLRESFPENNIRNFDVSSFESIIAGYENKIRNGAIKSGDQLMIMVDSHGAEPGQNMSTHQISSGQRRAHDLLNLSGSDHISLDRLQALSRLAAEKNIKLAIVDLSCHSGASLSLGNSRTCVISSTGPHTFAYGGSSRSTFSRAFVDQFRSGRNLEEAFLSARANSNDLGFPMISSPQGNALQEEMYPILMKYLNIKELTDDKFMPEIQKSVATNSCQAEAFEVDVLLDLTRNLERTNSALNFQSFRNALNAYADYRKTIQDRLKDAGAATLNETREICGTNGDCPRVTVSAILAMNPDQMITQYQNELTRAWNPQARERARNWLVYYQNAKRIQDELKRSNPQAASSSNVFASFPDITQKTETLARKVAIESRKVYSALYSAREVTGPNPCRDFTL